MDTYIFLYNFGNSFHAGGFARSKESMNLELNNLVNSSLFQILSWYLAIFPVLIAALSVNSSRMFLLNRFRVETERTNPHEEELEEAKKIWPLISVVIPARDEEDSIEQTVRAAS